MKKTYFLAPNFDYPPSSTISLGRIWTNPSDPGSCLNPDDALTLPTIHHAWKGDWKNEKGTEHKGAVGIWARFLQVVGIDAEASVNWDRNDGGVYNFEKLETDFIDPSPAFVKDSALAPAVKLFIRQHDFKKSVYMITGVKIARGADVALTRSREAGTHMKAGVNGTTAGAPVAVGPEVTVSSKNSETTSFGGSSDFVFAYRLREIYYEKGQIKHKEHNKGALHGIDGGSPEVIDQSTVPKPLLEISGLAGEDISGEDLAITEEVAIDEDDGEECAIITPKG
jgi:hypothetical protein